MALRIKTTGMATHGSVSAFEQSKEDWTSYVEHLGFYFAASDVTTDVNKRAILLSACGASTYKLIHSLIDPTKLNSTSYKDLIAKVKQHYDPKPSSIVQSRKFNKRTREPGESITKYVAALRQLAKHCDYGESLNDMLRDKLVCGMNHDAIQQKLMAQNPAELIFAKAMELAQRIEIAEKDARRVTTSKDSLLSKDSSNPNAQKCVPSTERVLRRNLRITCPQHVDIVSQMWWPPSGSCMQV